MGISMLYEFASVSAYVNLCYCGRAFVGQAALFAPMLRVCNLTQFRSLLVQLLSI